MGGLWTAHPATSSKTLCEAPQALSSQNRGLANDIKSSIMAKVLHLACLFH